MHIDVTIRKVKNREVLERLDRIDRRVSRLLDLAGAKPSAEIVFGDVFEHDRPDDPVRQPSPKEEFSMKATQGVMLSLEGLKDRLGKPATLSGPVEWTSSDPAVAEIVDKDGGKAALARGLGEAVIKATGDASSDEGVQEFQASAAVQVTSGDVVEGSVVLGAPFEQ